MTVKQFADNAKRLRCLIGETCVQARIGYGTTLLLDFGKLHLPDGRGYREPEVGLIVECCWRLETKKAVIAGWADQDEAIESRLPVCVGKRAVHAKVYRPSYMVYVEFSDDLGLWIFPDRSRDYEEESAEYGVSWYVIGRAIPD